MEDVGEGSFNADFQDDVNDSDNVATVASYTGPAASLDERIPAYKKTTKHYNNAQDIQADEDDMELEDIGGGSLNEDFQDDVINFDDVAGRNTNHIYSFKANR